jgi:hypothetical protein
MVPKSPAARPRSGVGNSIAKMCRFEFVWSCVQVAFLAGDPRRLGIETAHGEERPLRAGILAHPALAAVRGADDATELAHHPAVAIGREARREQVLSNLGEVDGRAGGR